MANFSSPSVSLLDVTPADKSEAKLNLDSDFRTDALKTADGNSAVIAADESFNHLASSQENKKASHVSSEFASPNLLNTNDLTVKADLHDRQNFKQRIADLLDKTVKNLDREKLELIKEAAKKELLDPVLAVFSTRQNTAVAVGLAGGMLIVPQVIPLLAGAGAAAGIYNFSKAAGFKFKKD